MVLFRNTIFDIRLGIFNKVGVDFAGVNNLFDGNPRGGAIDLDANRAQLANFFQSQSRRQRPNRIIRSAGFEFDQHFARLGKGAVVTLLLRRLAASRQQHRDAKKKEQAHHPASALVGVRCSLHGGTKFDKGINAMRLPRLFFSLETVVCQAG